MRRTRVEVQRAEGAAGVAQFAAAATGQPWVAPQRAEFERAFDGVLQRVRVSPALARLRCYTKGEPLWWDRARVVGVARAWLGTAPRGLRARVEEAGRPPPDTRPEAVLSVEERFVRWRRSVDRWSKLRGFLRWGTERVSDGELRTRECALCGAVVTRFRWKPKKTEAGLEAAHVAAHEAEGRAADRVAYWLACCADPSGLDEWASVAARRFEHRVSP